MLYIHRATHVGAEQPTVWPNPSKKAVKFKLEEASCYD
jgi:hypothetical protein